MEMSSCVGDASRSGRVLIVGATGFIGQFITHASLDAGHPTYVLCRSSLTICPPKAKALKTLEEKGAIIVQGVIKDQQVTEKILRENDIETVISAVGGDSILDQLHLVHAINAVGTIKRFLPSEFGHDVDRTDPVEPGLTMYEEKRKVRRLIEEYEIPYTYICCNSIASWPYYDNKHPSELLPPLDHIHIYGNGNIKGSDIGKFTMKTVDDIRTMNKNVHFRPPSNCLNINELASLWEKKIGRSLPRFTVSEDDLLAAAQENIIPESIVASLTHDIFIKGCQVNFTVDGPRDVEIGDLYPDETFRTVDECFTDFAVKLKHTSPRDTQNIATNPPNNSVVKAFPVTPMCA